MQEDGRKARARKRFVCTTTSDPTLRSRPASSTGSSRTGPNQRWVGDTAELRIGESGKRCLAAVLDLFSRSTVRWAINDVNDRHLHSRRQDAQTDGALVIRGNSVRTEFQFPSVAPGWVLAALGFCAGLSGRFDTSR